MYIRLRSLVKYGLPVKMYVCRKASCHAAESELLHRLSRIGYSFHGREFLANVPFNVAVKLADQVSERFQSPRTFKRGDCAARVVMNGYDLRGGRLRRMKEDNRQTRAESSSARLWVELEAWGLRKLREDALVPARGKSDA
jgi:hypothetical protein